MVGVVVAVAVGVAVGVGVVVVVAVGVAVGVVVAVAVGVAVGVGVAVVVGVVVVVGVGVGVGVAVGVGVETMMTETMDRLYLDLSQFTTVKTDQVLALEARVEELTGRLSASEARMAMSDTVKLRVLRDELARIVQSGKKTNRGQIISWIRKAREGAR